MESFKRPDKADVRAWLLQRQRLQQPPPAIDEIRRALGWILDDAPAAPAAPLPGWTCAWP